MRAMKEPTEACRDEWHMRACSWILRASASGLGLLLLAFLLISSGIFSLLYYFVSDLHRSIKQS